MPKLANVSINLNLPWVGGISGTWEPDESEVKAAWELYVEMVTRTPLGSVSPGEGSAREALTSIYSLFDTTREILKKYGPGIAIPKGGRKLSFGYLAVSMLNHVLRPCLTVWHPRLQAWERENPGKLETEWADREEFQKGLDKSREQLSQYASLFAKVADVPELLTEGTNAADTPA